MSSAEELLQQFSQRADHSECITYKVLPVNTGPINNFQYLASLRSQILTFASSIYSDFIWQEESFNLFIARSEELGSLILEGSVSFGDNVEDEWFVVYILMEISKKFLDVMIQLNDADGEFLLIEAAENIPAWMGPENSENRVWIYRGALRIIDIDESGRNVDGTMPLSAAIRAMAEGRAVVADATVQKCISNRIDKFPQYAFAAIHTCSCTLPKSVAKIIAIDPQLVSCAASTICDQGIEKKQATQIVSSMRKFGSCLEDFVTVPMKITRAHYAKMMFQKFHPPKKFHASMTSSSGSLVSQRAFDIGCRITCGLEIAYQISASQFGSVSKGVLDFEQYLAVIEKNYFEDIAALGVDQKSLLSDVGSRESAKDFLLRSIENNTPLLEEAFSSIPISRPPCVIIDSIIRSTKFANPDFLFSDAPCEPDEWLYFPPEEFEKEMLRRAGAVIPSSSELPTREPKSENDMKVMDEIVDRMKKFVGLSSDFEGVDNFSCTDGGHDASLEDGFNTEKFLEILRNEVSELSTDMETKNFNTHLTSTDVNDHWSSDSDDIDSVESLESDINSQIDEVQWPESSGLKGGISGVGTFVFPNTKPAIEEEKDLAELSDSDDGNDGQSIPNMPSSLMSEYLDQLDKELGGTTMMETFENILSDRRAFSEIPDQSPSAEGTPIVDIDLNLLKNLLESHASQIGGIGPASQLLGQLGLSFPKLQDDSSTAAAEQQQQRAGEWK